MAEKAYWQAVNLYGYAEDLTSWIAVVTSLAAPAGASASELPELRAQTPPPIREGTAARETQPEVTAELLLDDIGSWLKR